MPDPTPTFEELAATERIDAIADQFEAAWKAQRPPQVADFLPTVPEAERAALAVELLKIDRAYRQKVAATESLAQTSSRTLDGPDSATASAGWPALDDFVIEAEVGRGGMGVVYRARQKSLPRTVAIKMLKASAHADARQRQRFLSESKAASRLQHPNIAQVHQAGEVNGQAFLVLEFVPGGSLARALAGEPQSARAAANLVRTLALAVQYAHEQGIVHRDLKPANILVAGPFAVVKIADFGLAKELEHEPEGPTCTGEIIGTPSYMAPEQAEGKLHAIGPVTDVYALGAILYEMLVGRPPFKGESTLDTLEQVRTQEPVAPRRLQPKVPRDLETICLKALEKLPSRRYPSARDLADDLQRFLDGQSIRARPASAAGRLARWCQRKPAEACLLAAVALVVVGGFAGITWQWQRAEDHRRHAEAGAEENRRYLHAANVKLGQQAWKNGDVRQTRSLVARGVPRPGQEDLRDFAWRHLWLLCHADRRTLRGHEEDVYCAAFSPDGRLLATAGKDGTVRLWDVATGAQRAVLRGHEGEVNSLAFSPNGTTLASAGDDRLVKLWDADTGREQVVLKGHSREVVAITFAPDGKTLASGGKDQVVRLWDVDSRSERLTLTGHQHQIEYLAFAPNGRTLASASRDRTARLWDLASGLEGGMHSPTCTILRGHTEWVLSVAFSPDGKRLATTSADWTIRTWEPTSGREQSTLRGHTNWVQSVAFSPDGRALASAGVDSRIHVWDADTGRVRNVLQGHDGRVWCVAFAPDGQSLATAGADGLVKLWDPERMAARQSFPVRTSRIRSLAYAPDGRTLAVSADADLWLLNPATREVVVNSPQIGPLLSVAWAPDGVALALGSNTNQTCLWNPTAGRKELLVLEGANETPALAFSRDGRLLATGHQSHVALWNVGTQRQLLAFKAHDTEVMGAAFSPDGRTLATVSLDGSLKLWNVATGRLRDAATRSHRQGIYGVAYSPDGRTLATAGGDRVVKLWDAATGAERVALLGHQDVVAAVAFAADGRTLATGSHDRTVRLWDVATGQELLTLEGHAGKVHAVAFAPDGTALASGGEAAGEQAEVLLWLAVSPEKIDLDAQ